MMTECLPVIELKKYDQFKFRNPEYLSTIFAGDFLTLDNKEHRLKKATMKDKYYAICLSNNKHFYNFKEDGFMNFWKIVFREVKDEYILLEWLVD